ncbi:MAG: DUF2855 family protein [Saonia sp.]
MNTGTFLVNRSDFADCLFKNLEPPVLGANEVLFRIGSYAFTSNNITYAVVGDVMGYWNFFPAEVPYGVIPVWGFAEVVKSNNVAIKVGEHFYGYWPMGIYLKVLPIRTKGHGFVDGTAHRSKLPPLYNYYAKAPKSVTKEKEGYYSVIKPLFTTAYVNYRFLEEERFFNASQIVLTSASSKTALGIAYMLFANRGGHGKKIIGLTSKGNINFVSGTGFYDQVIAYDDLREELDVEATTVVDLAGNTVLLHNLGNLLKDKLKFTSLIGLADWKSAGSMKEIPNSKFFFAPDHAQKLYADLGPDEANKRINQAQAEFTKRLSKWIALVFITSHKDLKELYMGMLNGKVNPSKGYIVTINQE